MEPVEICRRQDKCKTARASVEAIWNDVEKFVMPLRVGNMYIIPQGENAVPYDRDDIYDSTAIFSSVKLSNSMHGSITNAWVRWYKRQFWMPEIDKDTESKSWLDNSTDREWAELYRANFDAEISACYQDLVGPGNCFFAVEAEEDDPKLWAGFNFTAIPLKESFFERNHRGDIYRFYRHLYWSATEIKSFCVEKWGENHRLPAAVEKELGDGGDPDKHFDLIFAIYTRPGKEKNTDQPYAATQRPVGSRYVLKSTKEALGPEGGYYEFPVFHCPYARTSGSIWGHGIGMLMAPTAKYINYWMAMEDMAIRKELDPPSLIRGGALMSDLDLQPGGQTHVRSLEDHKFLLSNGRIDFSKMSLKELRDMIREAFHNDELQLKESPQMSATEAQIRYELMNRVLGPTMGLIQNNLLSKTLDRTFKTLLRNKQFDEPPPMVVQKRAQLKVIYTGALMRAQQSDEVAAIERWLGQVGAAAKVFPTVMYVVDITKWARDLALKLGVPAEILRSEADVQVAVEQAQKVAAEQAKNAIIEGRGRAQQAQGDGAQAQQAAQTGAQQ